MIQTNERCDTDKSRFNSDHNDKLPLLLRTLFETQSQGFRETPREDSVISIKDSYHDVDIDVTQANDAPVGAGASTSFVILGTNALFFENTSNTESRKHLENIDHANKFCLFYVILKQSKRKYDSSISICRDHGRTADE